MGMFSTHRLHRERHFSPVGLLTAQRDIYLGGTHPLSDHSDPIQINQYRYDARYRLTASQLNQRGAITSHHYALDTEGNRTSYGTSAQQAQWHNNRVTQHKDAELSYDAARLINRHFFLRLGLTISTVVGGICVLPGNPGLPLPATTPPDCSISGNAVFWFLVNGAVADALHYHALFVTFQSIKSILNQLIIYFLNLELT